MSDIHPRLGLSTDGEFENIIAPQEADGFQLVSLAAVTANKEVTIPRLMIVEKESTYSRRYLVKNVEVHPDQGIILEVEACVLAPDPEPMPCEVDWQESYQKMIDSAMDIINGVNRADEDGKEVAS